MDSRKFIWIGVTVGSLVGGYIPTLWGSNPFSLTSWFLGGVGSFVGLWLGYQFSQKF